MQQAEHGGRRRGKLVVLAVLAVGAVAGVVSTSWWAMQSRHWTAAGKAPGTSGAATGDPRLAQEELVPLQERLTQAIGSGRVDEALLGQIESFVQKHPDFAAGHVTLSQARLARGDGAGAYAAMAKALELTAQPDPELLLQAGTLALRHENVERAQRHYRAAADAQPTNPKPLLFLAQAQIRGRSFDEARSTLLKALSLNSAQHEAYASLSDVYAQQGKTPLALEQIDKAIAATGAQDGARRAVYTLNKSQLLRRDNRAEEAILLVQAMPPEQRFRLNAVTDLATSWMMLGKPEEAARAYEHALAVDPTDYRFALGACQTHLKAGNRDSAVRMLDTARRLNPRAPQLPDLERQLAAPAAP